MKFLLNAYPKSGSKTYANILRRAIRGIRVPNEEELPELTDWVICQYEPVVHLAKFDNSIIHISIIRNPLDAITINVERMLSGFFGKQFYGIDTVDKNNNILSSKTSLSNKDKLYIDHEIERYNSYINCLLLNIDNIVLLTNEQIKNETATCTKNILSIAGIDYSTLPDNSLQESVVDNISFHPFSSNIKEYVMSNNPGMSNYLKVLDIMQKKQEKYHIPMQEKIKDR